MRGLLHFPGAQLRPDAVALKDGGFVAVWESVGQDGDLEGIFGQRYDASGAPIGGEFRINAKPSGSQRSPSVAALNDGGGERPDEHAAVAAAPGEDTDGARRHESEGQQHRYLSLKALMRSSYCAASRA